MWLMAEYQPVGLFSLKSVLATSSGGKSLLVPTPFAVKMALLDVAYRCWGAESVSGIWPTLRDLPIAMDFSDSVVVTNLFAKILKPSRTDAGPGSAHAGPMQKTIAFREYVWPVGNWRLALEVEDKADMLRLTELLLHINYFGKRGSFVQLMDIPCAEDKLPDTFVVLNAVEGQTTFSTEGLLQVLDDCGPKMSLAHADIYSGKNIRLGKERILHHVVLPYRLVRSSKSYSLYKRIL